MHHVPRKDGQSNAGEQNPRKHDRGDTAEVGAGIEHNRTSGLGPVSKTDGADE